MVLAPCREGAIPILMAHNTNLLSMSKFLEEIKQMDMVYTLLPCGDSEAKASTYLLPL